MNLSPSLLLLLGALLTGAAMMSSVVGATTTTTDPLIPQGSFIGAGYDITTNATLAPVYHLTFKHNKTFSFSALSSKSNQTYRVPDYMFAELATHNAQGNETRVFHNFASIQNEWVKITHWDSGFLGMVSNTRESIHYVDRSLMKDENMAHSYMTVRYLKLALTMADYPALHPAFVESVKYLPPTVNASNLWKFEAAIFSTYGVAVVTHANVGGTLSVRRWFNNCFLHSFNSSWVMQQSGWSFLGIIGSHSISQHFKALVDKKFRDHTHFELFCSGGDCSPSFLSNSTVRETKGLFDAWAPSILDRPWSMASIDFTARPLWELLEEYGYSQYKVLKEATELYLKKWQREMEKRIAHNQQRTKAPTPSYCKESED